MSEVLITSLPATEDLAGIQRNKDPRGFDLRVRSGHVTLVSNENSCGRVAEVSVSAWRATHYHCAGIRTPENVLKL